MTHLIIKICIISTFSSAFGALAKPIHQDLTPILDYYPNCSFEVIKTASSNKETEQPLANKITQSLFKSLREQAKDSGADALILTARKINKAKDQHDTRRMNKTNTLYIISYQHNSLKTVKSH